MNYYPHHIGDFNNATRHLSRIDRSIYRDLIELYYDKEAPLPNDIERISKLVLAVSEEEATGVERVLNEFFILTERGFEHDRCNAVVHEYQNKVSNASKAGKASAKARRLNGSKGSRGATGVERALNGCVTNVVPTRTNNQEPKPVTKKKKNSPNGSSNISAKDLISDYGVDEQVAKDWFTVRKEKGSKSLTKTAMTKIVNQAAKAGMTIPDVVQLCVEKEWRGFEAGWTGVNPSNGKMKLHPDLRK